MTSRSPLLESSSTATLPDAVEQASVPARSIARLVWNDLRPLILLGLISLTLAIFVRYGLHIPIPLTRISIPDRMLRALRYAAVVAAVIVFLAVVRNRLTIRGADGQRIPGLEGWKLAVATLKNDSVTARVVLAVATCLLMSLLLSIFAVWKAAIPLLSPWHWDTSIVGVERWLHGGTLPQDLTRRWFGPTATTFLDRMYYLWFRLLALFVVWQSFRTPSHSRTRALLSLALAYTLLGNIGAILLSSVGPVYYDRLVGIPSPYAAHAAYLATIPKLHASQFQLWIWQWLETDRYVPFGSISAMPSMHVAVATVMALASWEQNRWFGLAAWLYVLTILVASVQLNWHYALDGYAAILGTVAIWYLSAWLARRLGPASTVT
jgi:hypothetical protein